MTRLLRLGLLLAALLGAAVLLAPAAEAHATVVSSAPQDGTRLKTAPTQVTVTFDEPVGLGGPAYLFVTNSQGKRVDAGAARHGTTDDTVVDTLKPGLGDGTYTASFRVISADSHPVAGTIRFVVGKGALVHGDLSQVAVDEGSSEVFGLIRWVSFGGIALLGGAWLLMTVWPQGRTNRRAARLVWAGWGLAVFGGVGELLVQGPYSAGRSLSKLSDFSLLNYTLHTEYGVLHCLRIVLLGVFALLLERTFSLPEHRSPALPALVVGLAVVATFSAAGHAATTDPSWLSVPVDALHLSAMAVWLGGLALLVYALLPAGEDDELTAVLPVFSTAAFVSVVVLTVTGTYAAWRGIGTVHALTTSYGLLVIGKVVLFAGLIALGNLSRRAVQRRALAPAAAARVSVGAGGPADPGPDAPLADRPPRELETERLRRSVAIEVALAIAVLYLTSVLVAEPRGKEALVASYRQPVSASASLGGGRHVTVVADPGTHGPVQLTVSVDQGTPTTITATATQQADRIGPLPVDLTPRDRHSFDGSVTLPVAGAWRIDLVVTTGQYDAVTADVTLTLH